MKPPAKPLLIWDGECDFCRSWIARWKRATQGRVDYATYQDAAPRYPQIPIERFRTAVQLLEPDGRWYQGAEAVYRSLASAPRGRLAVWAYAHVPGFAAASEALYRVIARQRPLFTRITRALWGTHVVPPGERFTAWIFLRLLGATFAIAFVSLWTQIDGLAGTRGILPAREYLDYIALHIGPARFFYLPTLCWFGAGDATLHALCAIGTALSILLAIGVAPPLTLAGAWIAYASLANVSQDFLWFQWDSLLLETGFLSLFLAPWTWWSRPHRDPQPSRAGLWLLRWLLFRLMFSSAVAKLASGDINWRHLTALDYHYETQPLPPWTAWYAHHLPAWFQKLSTIVMFAIEGITPWFIIAPRRVRFAAAGAMITLQALIVVSGNYGFFNLLAIALCLLLLDDGVWPERLRGVLREDQAKRVSRARRSLVRPAAALLFALSLVPMWRVMRWPNALLGPLPAVDEFVAPEHIVNSYGLFSIMTTRRLEIVIEGSDDGASWKAYEFRYKPGDVMRRPRFMAPHMPRLDWQMWFAVLSDYRREAWFQYFCQRVLEGSPPVLALMEVNPFPHGPPRYLRAMLYDYHFTDAATRRASGAWWRREPLGLYCPVLTLEGGRLAPVSNEPPVP